MEHAISKSDRFDVAVIGAGVVGCAVARRLALGGARVLLLEKAADILAGASKANSAILHTGFDAPPGSLELHCMQRGYDEYMRIRAAMNLPVLETGAMVVAWSAEEAAKLDSLERKARDNGVDDVSQLSGDDVRRREPHLAPTHGALLVPREVIIDPWSPFLGYVTQVLALGGQVMRNAEVTAGSFDGVAWTLTTPQGQFSATRVVNCAGLFGDVIEQRLLGEASFEIRPRKGQFVVFDKAASRLLKTIILPVPTERTKGVVLCRTIFGNVLVGPTAEEQVDRNVASVTHAELQALVARAGDMLPALRGMPVTAVYAGLRPASEQPHYRIANHPERNFLSVGGIRSTGMTAALGIALHVGELLGAEGAASPGIALPAVRMPNLAEHLPRDWQSAGYDEIVCHCEMVTRREIEAALAGPLPPGDPGGLKRRTRCSMGRCQGFNCLGRLTELTTGRLPAHLSATAL